MESINPSTGSTGSLQVSSGRANARDFFLHLGSMVALYTVVISLLNLLFRVINHAFPDMITNAYYWGAGSQISMPVATLIIVFPIFIVLSWLVGKSYEVNSEKRQLGVRKWLIYITLFIAGIILAADLVTVLYKFLDGQDLTAAFLLKALAVLVVTGAVFGYYLQDIRERVGAKMRRNWAIIAGCLLLTSIILGFSVLGSPQTQRLLRYDNQKISDLQNIEWQIINAWQRNGEVPQSLPNIPNNQQTGEPYLYRKTAADSYELCAVFNKEMNADRISNSFRHYPHDGENWSHPAGKYCFGRTIDPTLYPITKPAQPLPVF